MKLERVTNTPVERVTFAGTEFPVKSERKNNAGACGCVNHPVSAHDYYVLHVVIKENEFIGAIPAVYMGRSLPLRGNVPTGRLFSLLDDEKNLWSVVQLDTDPTSLAGMCAVPEGRRQEMR